MIGPDGTAGGRTYGQGMRTTILLLVVLALAPSASAAQRFYRVTGGTTTITFSDAWLAVLAQGSVQFAGVDGTKVTATNRKDGPPIIRATFKVRKARGNILTYGSGSPSVTAKHRGGLAFSSLDRPGVVSFRDPGLIGFPGANRIDGVLPNERDVDRTPFLSAPQFKVGRPHGGEVRIVMRDVTWCYTGWMVFGATWDAPPTDDPWFPKAAMNAVVGDAVAVLDVKRR